MLFELKILTLVLLLITFCNSKPILENFVEENVCGYKSCPVSKPDMLNVHLVAHTHDDVGWLKTVDQYYYGSQTLIQKAGVQYILDSVIQELLKDPKKKFIYVESAFFFKWWKEQTEELKEEVKQLVNEGRLEFIGGAWSMNDEATTHYQSIIDQFSWGLRQLNDTFGTCSRPKIGWQIDPFGHSREMASIFAQMGYDGLFFGRLDYQDKRQRLKTKTPEMIWHGSANLGDSSDLFTGALYNQYQAPPGFCFDILCSDEPIIDGKHSPDNNVNKRVSDFFEFINKQRKYYRTNNIILTMGGDFTYMNANTYYKNLDKLIRYGNEKQVNGSDINLFYSTPSCYLKSLHDTGITWPTKSDDFFPYASDPHAYWTGYFTSRPTLKRYERIGNHFLQICKQLTAITPEKEKQLEPHLDFLRETMGVMQHHDAVSGTEKEKVAYDYAKRVDVGLRACHSNTKSILNKLVTGKNSENVNADHNTPPLKYKFDFESCLLLNISKCEVSEEHRHFMVTLYNPLAHSTFQYVRIPVPNENYEVKDYRGIPSPSQIVPVPASIKNLSFRSSDASYELVFLASELPPMGYKSYYVSARNTNKIDPITTPEVNLISDDPTAYEQNQPTVVGNKYLNLTFDSNGLLSTIYANGVQQKLSQEFLFYEGATGDNEEFRNRSSGAYIFRPNNTVQFVSKRANIEIFRGQLVDEVHQIFNDWVSQVIRVYKDENWIEFEWLVGPIPIDDNIGKEVITRYNTDIKSNGIFYTDSNGREMIKRKRNHRDTWNLELHEKVAGNYYPLTTKIALEDDNSRLAILVDRAQGGSSLEDGSLEIMVHRRLLHDDAFGVGEALNETAYGKGLVARGHHYLILGPKKTKSPSIVAQERFLQVKKLLPNWIFLSPINDSYDEWQQDYTHIYSAISLSLPQNIHFMTLEPWHEDELLVRFEHLLEKGEDSEYAKPVTFYLKDVLKDWKIVDIRETTLDGNEWLDSMKRLKFIADPPGTKYPTLFEDVDSEEDESKEDESKEDESKENDDFNKIKPKRMIEINKKEVPDIVLPTEEPTIVDDKDSDKFTITLKPMQIRTFILTLEQQI